MSRLPNSSLLFIPQREYYTGYLSLVSFCNSFTLWSLYLQPMTSQCNIFSQSFAEPDWWFPPSIQILSMLMVSQYSRRISQTIKHPCIWQRLNHWFWKKCAFHSQMVCYSLPTSTAFDPEVHPCKDRHEVINLFTSYIKVNCSTIHWWHW